MKLADRLLSVLEEYRTLGISEQIDYQKFYLYSLKTTGFLCMAKCGTSQAHTGRCYRSIRPEF